MCAGAWSFSHANGTVTIFSEKRQLARASELEVVTEVVERVAIDVYYRYGSREHGPRVLNAFDRYIASDTAPI